MLDIVNLSHGDQNIFNLYLIFSVGKWADELNFIDFGVGKWTDELNFIDFGVGK